MKYYDSDLQKLQQEVMEKERVEVKLKDLRAQKFELERKASELEKMKWEEQEDVDQLNGRSLKGLFYRVTGKLGEKLSEEEAEAYAAAVKYDTAKRELETLEGEISHCERRLADLRDCESRYENMLREKTEAVKASGTPEAARILEYEKNIAGMENQQRELAEAVSAGEQALSIAREVIKDLDSAKSWSTMDLVGGGFLADMAKYNKLDQVQDETLELQNALRGFRTELADVTEQVSGDLHLEIGDFLHFADFFFDGLIADWMVHDKIAESYDRAQKTYGQIQRVLSQLSQMQRTLKDKQDQERKKLEETVLRL